MDKHLAYLLTVKTVDAAEIINDIKSIKGWTRALRLHTKLYYTQYCSYSIIHK